MINRYFRNATFAKLGYGKLINQLFLNAWNDCYFIDGLLHVIKQIPKKINDSEW